jgi:PAS domain S-box-containing protein
VTGAPLPPREVERLALLHELQLPAAVLVPGLEAIARMAARQAGCPIGTVSIVDVDRQWLHAAHGVRRMEQDRAHSFSAHAIAGDGLFEVPDVAADPRFADHPLLSVQPPTRFFAGMPVYVDGLPIGTVNVVDHRPRTLDAESRAALADLAAMAESVFETRLGDLRHRAREDRARAASRTGSDWLWETDAEGVLTWISESVEQHTGWPPGREIGEHNRRVNRPPPGHLRASWERYLQARARHEPFRNAIAERDSAHGTMLVAISGDPLFDAAGAFKGYIGSARDVTAIVAEREQAQRSQQLLLKAFDDVRAGVMISGPDGRVLMSNVAWRRKIGRYAHGEDVTWEQLLRRMVSDGVYPDAVGREEEFIAWRLSIASPEATLHELRFEDQDALVSDQRLPDGTVIHLSLDITERRRAEREMMRQSAELEASQARTAAVLRAVPDLWFVVDREDRYLHCSDDHHPWLVLPFDQMRGQPFAFALPPHESRQSLASVRAARETGEVQRIEYELKTFDGQLRTFEARVSPMPNGEVLYLTRDLTDLRRLERDMQIMQRALEADAAVPMVVCDATLPDTPVVYVNTAFERLTGYGRDEVLGRNCRFLQEGESNQAAREVLRRAIAAERSCTVALTNRRKDGSVFINELHLAPVHNAAGRLIQYIGVLDDVTDRVRDAERLRLSEDLYRSVAATISDGLLVIAASGAIVACNPPACEALGEPTERLVGRRLSQLGFVLNDENDGPIPRHEHPVRKALAGAPAVRDQPYQLHRPDGSVRTMLLSARALNASLDDASLSCLVTFRDVTDRRAAEKALAEAEERWKFALEGAGDGVWDYDEDTRRTYFSPRWKQMLGFADDEIGHSLREWSDRVHPDDKERVQAEIVRYRSGAIADYRTEHRLRHKDGHWIWVLDRGKIVARHADGRPRRVVGTHTDITRLKQAEQALRDKQAAELASRAKSEFLSRMSHEMRTPLNAVIGFTQLLRLQTDGSPEKVAEYADHVLRAGEHLLALVNEVLDLQRVEEGKAVMQPEVIELAPLVASALDLLQPMAQRHQIALSSLVAPDVWVHCDRRSLRQVLINVASNAVKYNRPGGWVCVSLLPSATPGRITLAIEDTGSGLDDEQIARLFQPFERLGHESSDIEGSGLGLVIARALTREMHGELTLSSVPGAGTLARLDLPSADSPDTAPGALDNLPPAPPAEDAAQRTTLRMLYVEDNRINALLFEEAMRLLGGWELRVAEDGAAALAAVDGWTPQVLVLDAHLPDMTGFEVLERLRRRPELAQVPAFMCSADAMPEDIQRAHDVGFRGYWTKPIALATVSAELDALRASTAP